MKMNPAVLAFLAVLLAAVTLQAQVAGASDASHREERRALRH